MRALLRGSVALLALCVSAPAFADGTAPAVPAADAGAIPASPTPAWSWTGFYGGIHVSGGWGMAHFKDPFGPSIYGDDVSIPSFALGAELGYNWQLTSNPNWVLGVEADGDWMSSDGTNTCGALNGGFVSYNCHARPDMFATLAGRIGRVIGSEGHTLLYAKAGLGYVHDKIETFQNNDFFDVYSGFGPGFEQQFDPTTKTYSKWGGVFGIGAEMALTPGVSMKIEYNYVDAGKTNVTTPSSVIIDPTGSFIDTTAPGRMSVNESLNIFRLGVNYKFGQALWGDWDGVGGAPTARSSSASDWQFEAGARYYYSSGSFQWDNYAYLSPVSVRILESRLTYKGLTGNSGEVFARVESPWNIFVQGVLGMGSINNGTLNDEDWGIFGVLGYSNTISNEGNGDLTYATGDVGFDVLRGDGYRVGPFIGYSYLKQKVESFGCIQIANPLFPCLAPGDETHVGRQDTIWNAIRIGLSGQATLAPRWKLSGDAAYLAGIDTEGRDDHLLRTVTTFFNQAGSGRGGVQLDSKLSYDWTDHVSLGVGGRYWGMWTNDAGFNCTGCGGAGVTSINVPAKLNTERYGAFLEIAYKFGYDAAASTASNEPPPPPSSPSKPLE